MSETGWEPVVTEIENGWAGTIRNHTFVATTYYREFHGRRAEKRARQHARRRCQEYETYEREERERKAIKEWEPA